MAEAESLLYTSEGRQTIDAARQGAPRIMQCSPDNQLKHELEKLLTGNALCMKVSNCGSAKHEGQQRSCRVQVTTCQLLLTVSNQDHAVQDSHQTCHHQMDLVTKNAVSDCDHHQSPRH